MRINSNLWAFLWIIAICVTLSFVTIKAVEVIKINNDYNRYVMEMTQNNLLWFYNCDSSWQSGWYNCPTQLRNITGYYCNGTMICQNDYEIKNVAKR